MSHAESEIVLRSFWRAATEDTPALYRLVLRNGAAGPLGGFRLGVSGPARIGSGAVLRGGSLVDHLSTYAEIAPPLDTVLQPGAEWTVEIENLDFPVRHWTDGTASAFLVRADGTTQVVRTEPTRLEGSDAPLLSGTAIYQVPVHPPVPVSIIPWPAEVRVAGRRTAPDGFAIEANTPAALAARDGFAALTALLFPGEGLVRPASEGGLPVRLELSDGRSEAYAIQFSAGMARIEAADHKGLLYGLVTLGQMARGARLHRQSLSFPTSGTIVDQPAMPWRGCHLDVARRFYGVMEIERFLAILAWNKLNVFHWHLSDDEAFRLAIEGIPQLAEGAPWRGHGLSIPPVLGSGPEKAGGVYRRADVDRIVATATAFGVDVVPEVDMPGHCYALLAAMPQLRDATENGLYHSIQAFPNNSLNPAVPEVYETIEALLRELATLFPSPYVHVGADEVPEDAWASSGAANAMRQALGVTGAAPLQAAFLKRLQAMLTGLGKVTGAWEEASHGGGFDKARCYLVGWRDTASSRALAAEGYDVVVAPGQAYYLDMANGEDWHECGSAWAGWSSVETAYRFEPASGWSEDERRHLLGVQACIWSEPMTDRAVFDRLVFPRLSAIAETGWSSNRDFDRFRSLVGLMPNLYGQYEGR